MLFKSRKNQALISPLDRMPNFDGYQLSGAMLPLSFSQYIAGTRYLPSIDRG